MTDRIVAGFMPLMDSALLIVAKARGFAAEEGIELSLRAMAASG